MTAQTHNIQQVTVMLHKAVYDKFESQFKLVHPNEATTAIQVGHALGVQAVLKAMREQLVVS